MDGAQQPNNDSGLGKFTPQVAAPTPPTSSDGITWTASEFVAHQKTPGWYGLLALAALATAFLVWLITKDVVSAVVIVVAAAMLGTFAARQPRELAYRLDDSGLTIDVKHYSYGDFRSFSIMTEGAFASIVFMPLKRFAPLTTIYYDPNDEDLIVSLLSERLPLEERKQDAIERLMWRIRF